MLDVGLCVVNYCMNTDILKDRVVNFVCALKLI